MKNTNLLIIGAVVLLLLGGGAYFMMSSQNTSTPGESMQIEEKKMAPTGEAMMGIEEAATGSSGVMTDESVKTFTVTGGNYSFDVKEMKVKQGDTVKIVFKNGEGMHDWVIDEFNARTKVIQAGAEETITFVADKAGTFEYYCSVGQHRANGMVGNLIVE